MAALESALLLHDPQRFDPYSLDLAEQQLILCADGCKGAEVSHAFEYILKYGITFEEDLHYDPHPYSEIFAEEVGEGESAFSTDTFFESTSTCSKTLHRVILQDEDADEDKKDSYSSRIIYPLEGYCWLPENTDLQMKQALLTFGPLYVSMNAGDSGIASAEYMGGAVNASHCDPHKLNHSVLLVGYTARGTWILKNSWGRSWNGDGYFEVVQGRGMCGINQEMAWPLLKSSF